MPISQLPAVSERRLATKLTKDALRQVRGGHPWIFDGGVVSIADGGFAGDLAVVFDSNRRFVAIGLYDPESPIRVRVLHQGKPLQIDGEFFATKITEAFDRRADLETDPNTNAFRIVNGENDGLSGLIVDRYAAVAVVKIYSEAWFPHLTHVVEALTNLAGIDSVILRMSRDVGDGFTFELEDGDLLAGPPPPDVVKFLENGLTFGADLRKGHKTGHFLDQRDNRNLIRTIAKDRNVLDVFACTGGFSVYAADGGAKSVTSIDISRHALDLAKANMERNNLKIRHELIADDAYRALDKLAGAGEMFDLVVVDPPSFAHAKDQIPRAKSAYKKLARAAAKLVAPGGHLFHASCSNRVEDDEFFDMVYKGIRDAGRDSRDVGQYGHASDHPVTFPQGKYLKAVLHRFS